MSPAGLAYGTPEFGTPSPETCPLIDTPEFGTPSPVSVVLVDTPSPASTLTYDDCLPPVVLPICQGTPDVEGRARWEDREPW